MWKYINIILKMSNAHHQTSITNSVGQIEVKYYQ